MKSLLTLIAVASIATIGFTGCASSQGSQKNCPLMAKKCSTTKPCCCPSSTPAACPMKKKTSSQ
ncbi:MAG: hypothetical protein WCH98_06855 [Verrucomicrobiota bacterium]